MIEDILEALPEPALVVSGGRVRTVNETVCYAATR